MVAEKAGVAVWPVAEATAEAGAAVLMVVA